MQPPVCCRMVDRLLIGWAKGCVAMGAPPGAEMGGAWATASASAAAAQPQHVCAHERNNMNTRWGGGLPSQGAGLAWERRRRVHPCRRPGQRVAGACVHGQVSAKQMRVPYMYAWNHAVVTVIMAMGGNQAIALGGCCRGASLVRCSRRPGGPRQRSGERIALAPALPAAGPSRLRAAGSGLHAPGHASTREALGADA